MQTQVENLALHLFCAQNMDEDMRHNILLMKLSARKAEAEKVQAEVEKKKQVSSKTVVFKINKQIQMTVSGKSWRMCCLVRRKAIVTESWKVCGDAFSQ